MTWRHSQAMQHYLRSTKDVLRTLDCNKTELDVVLGNEACDLDSAVAAIVYGFFLQSKRGVSERTVLGLKIDIFRVAHGC